MLWLFAYAATLCMHELKVCEIERYECQIALERVPPAEWRRIADELAECKQHLEESEKKQ